MVRRTHAFVLRILIDTDDAQTLHGQISEPGSGDDWRATFVDAFELFAILNKRLGVIRSPVQNENMLTIRRKK